MGVRPHRENTDFGRFRNFLPLGDHRCAEPLCKLAHLHTILWPQHNNRDVEIQRQTKLYSLWRRITSVSILVCESGTLTASGGWRSGLSSLS